MFTSLVELPAEIKQKLLTLDNRNRLIKDFAIIGFNEEKKPSGEKYYRLGMMIGNRKYWAGFRQQLESQLISAGVCFPDFTPIQELAWKELKQILCQFYNPLQVQEAIFQDCRNSTLRGWIDEIESKLPLVTYLRCKKLIQDLGADNFELDFEWYFKKPTPDDYWRGLE